MSEPATRPFDVPRSDFGEPEAEFGPTFGQTAAGVLVCGSIAAACLGGALFATHAMAPAATW